MATEFHPPNRPNRQLKFEVIMKQTLFYCLQSVLFSALCFSGCSGSSNPFVNDSEAGPGQGFNSPVGRLSDQAPSEIPDGQGGAGSEGPQEATEPNESNEPRQSTRAGDSSVDRNQDTESVPEEGEGTGGARPEDSSEGSPP